MRVCVRVISISVYVCMVVNLNIFVACVSQYINFVGILFLSENNFMFPITSH